MNTIISDSSKWLTVRSKLTDKYLCNDSDLVGFIVKDKPATLEKKRASMQIVIFYITDNKLRKSVNPFRNNKHYKIEIPSNTTWLMPTSNH